MRVFVIGERGLLGTELGPALRRHGHQVRATDLPDGDVTKPERIRSVLGSWQADWIVNLAAMTAVDACESDPEGAYKANAEGAGNVARLAGKSGVRMLQVSTDYVFDGTKGRPYVEEDRPNPLSVYGQSKLGGEQAVQSVLPTDRCLVVRGQSLYGGGGKKGFPDAILARAFSLDRIPVVTDQVIQPTWARDFAEALIGLMERESSGTFHFAASGSCSWNECARAALDILAGLGQPPQARIEDTTAAALGRKAPRPAYSVFDTTKYATRTGVTPRGWREMLVEYAGLFWKEA